MSTVGRTHHQASAEVAMRSVLLLFLSTAGCLNVDFPTACAGDETLCAPVSDGGDATTRDSSSDTAPANSDADSGGSDGAADAADSGTPDGDAADVPPAKIDLAGKTRNGGLIAPDVVVIVTDATGVDKTTTSDADGNFSMTSVLPPYDIYVADGTANILYQGLSTKTPVLPRTKSVPTNNEDDVAVGLSSATPAQSFDATTVISFAATRKAIGRGVVDRMDFYPNAASGTYGPASASSIVYTHLVPSPEVTFDFHFVRTTYVTSGTPPVPVPLSYGGYATLSDLTFSTATSPTLPALTVIDPTESLISGGNYVPPTGFTAEARQIYLTKGPRTSVEVFRSDASPLRAGTDPITAFSFAIPGVPGFAVAVCGEAAGPAVGSGTAATSRACKANVVSAPSLILLGAADPKDPAAGSTTAGPRGPFTFDHAETKQVYVVDIRSEPSDPARTTWIIYTSKKSATIPASRPGLNSKAGYRWSVSSVAPFESLDELLTEDQLFSPHDRDVYETSSKSVTFTTAL